MNNHKQAQQIRNRFVALALIEKEEVQGKAGGANCPQTILKKKPEVMLLYDPDKRQGLCQGNERQYNALGAPRRKLCGC